MKSVFLSVDFKITFFQVDLLFISRIVQACFRKGKLSDNFLFPAKDKPSTEIHQEFTFSLIIP